MVGWAHRVRQSQLRRSRHGQPLQSFGIRDGPGNHRVVTAPKQWLDARLHYLRNRGFLRMLVNYPDSGDTDGTTKVRPSWRIGRQTPQPCLPCRHCDQPLAMLHNSIQHVRFVSNGSRALRAGKNWLRRCTIRQICCRASSSSQRCASLPRPRVPVRVGSSFSSSTARPRWRPQDAHR